MTQEMTVDLRDERLAFVRTQQLARGAHGTLDNGMCVMEAVAYVAGEPWTDHPACACPVLAAFMRAWNDAITTDEHRTRLLAPFIPRLVGSRSTPDVERRRADLAGDWAIRTCMAAWLATHPTLAPHAEQIRALPPLLTAEQLASAMPILAAAAQDAAAARAAAWAAARDAARDAAWAAAWAAARDADDPHHTGDAAYAATTHALAPVVEALELSAIDLIERMLAVTPESLAG